MVEVQNIALGAGVGACAWKAVNSELAMCNLEKKACKPETALQQCPLIQRGCAPRPQQMPEYPGVLNPAVWPEFICPAASLDTTLVL